MQSYGTVDMHMYIGEVDLQISKEWFYYPKVDKAYYIYKISIYTNFHC